MTLLLVAMQYRSGAFTADMAADYDEPAHAVSSLMVHDYLAYAFPRNPLTFGRTFYAHYSKVGIGHWPPLFYCGEGIWMLFAGRGRVQLLLFVALCGVALLCSIFLEVQRRASTPAALVSVAILLHQTAFHDVLLRVRSDMLMALLVFWAAVYCGEFVRSNSRRSRNLFVVFTIAALLVHGRAAVLFLLPFFLLPVYPPKAKWKWITAGVVLLVTMTLPPALRMSNHASPAVAEYYARVFFLHTIWQTTWVGTALAVAGLWFVFRDGPGRSFWTAMAGLAASGFVFYVLIPVAWEDRYIVPSLVAVAVLAGAGVQVGLNLVGSLRPMLQRILGPAAAIAALAWMVVAVYKVETKSDPGYRKIVAGCLLCGHDVALVAADAVHEGDLIAEASLADPAMAHTVLRASKVLARSTWAGYNYRLQFSNPSQVLAYLDQAHVSLVVIQNQYSRAEVVQLRSALAQDGGEWVAETGIFPEAGITVFRRLAPGAGGGT